MNEDPTRIMGSGDGPERRRPPRGRPPQQRPRGNMRLVVALMGAVIAGLLIALFVVSCSGGTETVTVTTEPEYVTPTQPVSPGHEENETPEEETENEAEGSEEEETGGIEELEPEEGGTEEVLPEEEGGLGLEEEEGGGVEAP
ncbi:MAG TPA: hypothetical protein VHV53_04275 [Solirubrobacterales bacterium]|jgi:hypothetical protein|nr:hypothetical protein [Solirubrobacterales bacterium]